MRIQRPSAVPGRGAPRWLTNRELYLAHVLVGEPASTSPEHALIRHRTAPPRQIVGLRAFCETHGFFQRFRELFLDRLALEPAAQEVRPQKLAERNRFLGKSAEAAQLAREAAERIVAQAADRRGEIGR